MRLILLLLGSWLRGGGSEETGLSCDFEGGDCQWEFESLPENSSRFDVVTGNRDGQSGVHFAMAALTGMSKDLVLAKFVSHTLSQTEPTCFFTFDYQVKGDLPVTLLVYLEKLDGTLLMREKIQMPSPTWTKLTVSVGAIIPAHEARIVIEAEALPTPNSPMTDFFIDNIVLHSCQEQLYHADFCRYTEVEKYTCSGTSLCIPFERVCDMRRDCPDGDDEDDVAHNCTKVPLGARCSFEPPTETPGNQRATRCGWETTSTSHDFHWSLTSVHNFTVAAAEREMQTGVQLGVPLDHTLSSPDRGHYMLIFSNNLNSKKTTQSLQNTAALLSPSFPPTASFLGDKSSPFYQQCRVTFYYNHNAHPNAWLVLRLKIVRPGGPDGHRYHDLWGHNSAEARLSHKPVFSRKGWYRASAIIEPQSTEYRLRIETPKINMFNDFIAIDDISLTPQCFIPDPSAINARVNVSKLYTLTTCGAKGPLGPTQRNCNDFYSNTSTTVDVGYMDDVGILVGGVQRWKAPAMGQYLITAYGAAGGCTRSSGCQNYGARAITAARLDKGQEVEMIVGQMGESVCDKSMQYERRDELLTELDSTCVRMQKFKGTTDDSDLKRQIERSAASIGLWLPDVGSICDAVDHSFYMKHKPAFLASEVCRLRDNGQPLPSPLPFGAGGGGATFVTTFHQYDRVALAVAAGGGGEFISANGSVQNGGRGRVLDDLGAGTGEISVANLTRAAAKDRVVVVAGGGSGWRRADQPRNPALSQADRYASGADWHVHAADIGRGGECSMMIGWNHSGGFGGGGASCGPGGGGGGGYRGGSGGYFASGGGGFSFAAHPDALLTPTANPSSGQVLISPCLRICAAPSLCEFDLRRLSSLSVSAHSKRALEQILTDTPSLGQLQRCRCPTGEFVNDEDGELVECPVLVRVGDQLSEKYTTAITICTLLVLLAIALLAIWMLCQRHRHDASSKYISAATELPLNPLPTGSYQSEYNPNYEFTCGVQELTEVPRSCVTLIKALGQGAFGEVYEGFLTAYPMENDMLPVAVKTLPELASEQAQLDFHMEALIMSKFTHVNIVRFIGVCFEKMPRLIVLELLAGGDLKSFLRESRPRPDTPPEDKMIMADLIHLALDVAYGCQYLEENHFIHRDIAARNCLLTQKGPGRVVKIADFGMARDIYRADYYRKGGKAMLPVKWMPPEAFLDGVFTAKTDIWSYGVLLWEIFALGYMPYPGRGNQEVMQLVTAGGRLEAPTACPNEVYCVMSHCWNTLSEERPNFSSIIEQLKACLQNPAVAAASLPVFRHRTVSSSTDASSIIVPSNTLYNPANLAKKPTGSTPSSLAPDSNSSMQGTGIHPRVQPPYSAVRNQLLLPDTPSATNLESEALLPPASDSPHGFSPTSVMLSSQSTQQTTASSSTPVNSPLLRASPTLEDDVFSCNHPPHHL